MSSENMLNKNEEDQGKEIALTFYINQKDRKNFKITGYINPISVFTGPSKKMSEVVSNFDYEVRNTTTTVSVRNHLKHENRKFVFNGKVIDLDKTLEEQGITDNATIYVSRDLTLMSSKNMLNKNEEDQGKKIALTFYINQKNRKNFKITGYINPISVFTGPSKKMSEVVSNFDYEVRNTTTTVSVRNHLKHENRKFVFNGKVIDLDKTLEEQGITDNATIYVSRDLTLKQVPITAESVVKSNQNNNFNSGAKSFGNSKNKKICSWKPVCARILFILFVIFFLLSVISFLAEFALACKIIFIGACALCFFGVLWFPKYIRNNSGYNISIKQTFFGVSKSSNPEEIKVPDLDDRNACPQL